MPYIPTPECSGAAPNAAPLLFQPHACLLELVLCVPVCRDEDTHRSVCTLGRSNAAWTPDIMQLKPNPMTSRHPNKKKNPTLISRSVSSGSAPRRHEPRVAEDPRSRHRTVDRFCELLVGKWERKRWSRGTVRRRHVHEFNAARSSPLMSTRTGDSGRWGAREGGRARRKRASPRCGWGTAV